MQTILESRLWQPGTLCPFLSVAAGPVDGIYWCIAVGSYVSPGDPGYHFNEVFAWVPNQVSPENKPTDCTVRMLTLRASLG
jgi:hypothetical protein